MTVMISDANAIPNHVVFISRQVLALQSEKKRLEKESKTLSERVIEAQRASAPVPRCVTASNSMYDRGL